MIGFDVYLVGQIQKVARYLLLLFFMFHGLFDYFWLFYFVYGRFESFRVWDSSHI
jgi:hypothetical protein